MSGKRAAGGRWLMPADPNEGKPGYAGQTHPERA
jgi:hypothetical protein